MLDKLQSIVTANHFLAALFSMVARTLLVPLTESNNLGYSQALRNTIYSSGFDFTFIGLSLWLAAVIDDKSAFSLTFDTRSLFILGLLILAISFTVIFIIQLYFLRFKIRKVRNNAGPWFIYLIIGLVSILSGFAGLVKP